MLSLTQAGYNHENLPHDFITCFYYYSFKKKIKRNQTKDYFATFSMLELKIALKNTPNKRINSESC